MLNLAGILLFAEVLEAGSFSAAARKRRTTRAVVAKQIARLEEQLGSRLLHRSTRRMSATDLGHRVYERALRIRKETDELRALVESERAEIGGVLRINSVSHFGRHYVQPVALRFARQYPKVTVDLRLEDQMVDLVRGGVDLAIRIGTLVDSSFIARRLADVDVVICAAPSYLEAHGAPQHPTELADRACVVYASTEVVVERWRYVDAGRPKTVQVSGGYRVNDGDMLLDAVASGIGIGLLPRFLAASALDDGRIVELLTRFELPPYAPIHALYPARQHLPAKTRAFLASLTDHIGSPPIWSRSHPTDS